MTTSHCSRCSIALYIHKADLLWVWTGYGAPIITNSTLHVRNQVNHLSTATMNHEVRPSIYIRLGGGILMTTSHRRRCWNTLYMYEADLRWVWIGWVASIITYNMIHLMLVNARPRPPWHWETWFSVWVQSTCTWPLSTSNVCQTFDINWTWNECDKVIGMAQPQHMVYPSHHNHCHSHSHSSKF